MVSDELTVPWRLVDLRILVGEENPRQTSGTAEVDGGTDVGSRATERVSLEQK